MQPKFHSRGHCQTIQDIRKRANIGKFSLYESIRSKKKQPLMVEFEDKPRERGTEVAKKKNSCHNCGLTDHYANNFPRAKKKVYAIEKVPEEETPTEDSDQTPWVMPSENHLMRTETQEKNF
ncbi:hypothetical protein O181_109567 [Austropuccinia psidii MF-1]|uniref:Uncharacterized protein n=1 Tax=Austropuccinia psidii MF-1 TaxID=1389203 RepID=A0A9Q3JY44_9BASI|nr:hypothetical protein [Austropuccinia psidii MF-1]